MDWECSCDRCEGRGPNYDEPHDDDCCCYECHEEFHDNYANFAEVCIYCDELEMEAKRGDAKRKEGEEHSPEISEGEGPVTESN